MQNNRLNRLRRLLLGLLFAASASLTPITLAEVSVAHADGSGSLTISPGTGRIGSKFHVHGTGLLDSSLTNHDLDLTVFDASNNIVDQGSVPASDDGSIDADINTDDGSYTGGTYTLLVSYTYWGVWHDPADPQRITCDFCPIKTVPLADSVAFTIH